MTPFIGPLTWDAMIAKVLRAYPLPIRRPS